MNQINLETSPNKPLVDGQKQVGFYQYGCSYLINEHVVSVSQHYPVEINSHLALNKFKVKTRACTSSISAQKISYSKEGDQVLQDISRYTLNSKFKVYKEELKDSKYIIPKYIKLAEHYILTNIRQSPLKVEEIAAYANVSIRTLSSGFRKYRNISPSLFIRDLRLQMVREELINAEVGTSIAEIAYASGYLNLGTFIRLYKKKFRELPSTTLRYYLKE